MKDTNYKIRAWMGANRVSGCELAKKIDMPYPTFRMKMLGNSEWKLTEIKALIETTGLPYEELF